MRGRQELFGGWIYRCIKITNIRTVKLQSGKKGEDVCTFRMRQRIEIVHQFLHGDLYLIMACGV